MLLLRQIHWLNSSCTTTSRTSRTNYRPNRSKTTPRENDTISPTEEQEHDRTPRRTNNKTSALAPTNFQPGSQNWGTFSSKRYWLITVEPHEGLYRKHQSPTVAVIHHFNPKNPCKVLIANLIKERFAWSVKLNARLVDPTVDDHPDFITEYNNTHVKTLWITTTTYNDRDMNFLLSIRTSSTQD